MSAKLIEEAARLIDPWSFAIDSGGGYVQAEADSIRNETLKKAAAVVTLIAEHAAYVGGEKCRACSVDELTINMVEDAIRALAAGTEG